MKRYSLLLLSIICISCASNVNRIYNIDIRKGDEIYIDRGISDIFFQNNRLYICYSNTGEIREVYINSYLQMEYVNNYNIGCYEQIDIKRNYILYISGEDWQLHIFDMDLSEDKVVEPMINNDFIGIKENGDYVIIDRGGTIIKEQIGYIIKERALYFEGIIERIKIRNGMVGIQSNNGIDIYSINGVKIGGLHNEIRDFELYDNFIIGIRDKELIISGNNKTRTITLDNEYDLLVVDKGKMILYNRNTGLMLLNEILLY